MVYLSNSFSLGMLPDMERNCVSVKELGLDKFKFDAHHATSIWGHEGSAPDISKALGFPVQFNRQSIILQPDDVLLVAQYSGPRLPEGCTELPTNNWRWFMIYVANRQEIIQDLLDTVEEFLDLTL